MTETGYTDKKFLSLLARPNWRRTSTPELVSELQYLQDITAHLDASWIKRFAPSECGAEEYNKLTHYYYSERIAGLVEEIERRRDLPMVARNTNREIIQTIKESIPIEDVLEWYTEVFLHKRQRTYRCTLHGEDRTPSGVIYPEEGKCWCFGCNRGGDIFDVVQLFERVGLPQAIAKLARHIGLDTKPIGKMRQGTVLLP